MAREKSGLARYVRAAFVWKVDIKGLGNMPLNLFLVAVFAVLGLLNPGFWLIGAAVEVGLLLVLAGNERFQKLVDALELGKAFGDRKRQAGTDPVAAFEKQARLVASLDSAARARYQAVVNVCSEVLKGTEGSASGAGDLLQSGGLGQLLWIFLKLLASRQKVTATLSQTSRASIEADVKAAQEKLAAMDESSAVARSLKATLEIQQKRLDNLVRAEESLKVTDAELDRIEKQAALIREEVNVSGDPQFLSVRLDGIMDSLSGTTKWMSEHDELFGGMEAEAEGAAMNGFSGLGKRNP